MLPAAASNTRIEGAPARCPRAAWRKLATRRGDYVLRWRPEDMKYLLADEGFAPADLAQDDPASNRALVRELFLLGLEDEMAVGGQSPISRFARRLLGFLRRKDEAQAD